MDFNKLMQRMRDLDQPVGEAAVQECGDPMMGSPMPPPMSSMNDQPPPAHPSMSVNLNAQGMDNIESLLKLMTKVNPDMINQKEPMAPPVSIGMPSLLPPGPSIGSLGNLDSGPLKMLPDLDNEPEGDHPEPDADNMGGPSDNDADNKIDIIQKSMGDVDGDGDHDMDDHEAEKEGPGPDGSAEHEGPEGEEPEEDEEKKDEAWANEPDTEVKSVDYMNNQLAGGMNGPKKSFSGKPYRGDNPMAAGAYESKDQLRASIRAELLQRLSEAKGAK